MKQTLLHIKNSKLSSYKLIKCIINYYKYEKFLSDIENCKSSNLENILKEFYKRFIIPIYIPILTIIPFIIIITSKENSNYQKTKVATFLIGFLVIVLSETTIKLISGIIYKNILFVSLPLILLVILYLFFISKFSSNFIKNSQ